MVRIKVKVVPNSKQQKVEKLSESEYKVYVKSPPAKGKANKELIEVLSDYFEVPKSRIKIISGFSSREKIVELI